MAAQIATSACVGVAGRQQGCDIGYRSRDGTSYFRHSHFPFLFLFSSSSSGFGHAALFLAVRSLRVFPTHPLHIPSRIDRGELPGVAV